MYTGELQGETKCFKTYESNCDHKCKKITRAGFRNHPVASDIKSLKQ